MDETDSDIPITGTGKTLSMTGYAYLDYKKGAVVWSNYHTSFSEKVIGIQKMIDLLNQEANREDLIDFNLLLLVTEIQDVLDACGSSQREVLYIDYFLRQMRKIGGNKGEVNLFWDNQRYMSVQKRLRIHTNRVLIPYKTHFDNEECNKPKCNKPHLIYIYSQRPFKENPIRCFNAEKVGKMYDTHEKVHDTLKIPTAKELKKEMQDD